MSPLNKAEITTARDIVGLLYEGLISNQETAMPFQPIRIRILNTDMKFSPGPKPGKSNAKASAASKAALKGVCLELQTSDAILPS
jgi:hypothetical protein